LNPDAAQRWSASTADIIDVASGATQMPIPTATTRIGGRMSVQKFIASRPMRSWSARPMP
jgi:hypothetical protein